MSPAHMRDNRQNKVANNATACYRFRFCQAGWSGAGSLDMCTVCNLSFRAGCANSNVTEGEEPELSKQALRSNHVPVLIRRRKYVKFFFFFLTHALPANLAAYRVVLIRRERPLSRLSSDPSTPGRRVFSGAGRTALCRSLSKHWARPQA